ncbi:aminotransferase class I/II-fold pyridoxal phosphate-dependent enzyme (plasmid) [Paroceanicella profunda]|uniref:Aminotransferase class I/II-fold pyridoxal phosphate-dependent enzyme n=1 Tax=Paroceanicella profunda TaxID=2579971 RepID=A0A5B8FJ37_9RHOB|nr:GntG family PLP-dependent aldolase [Paroceanicella profunda]QDL94471.1 aminotransferase class I/II-fold pyridoxal phosphate-dependent enzyme [Paroceanicella profunda]
MSPHIEIDLISDTSTRPSAGMLAAMTSAETGDEQRYEDPTTRALEARVAELLGMEAAVFLPSGTMCNQIAFLVHCRPGDEIITAANAHVFGSEGAGAAALAGAQFRTIETADGIFDADAFEAALRAPRHRSPRSRVVSAEQTTNRGGGAIWPAHTLTALAERAAAHGLAAHIDGARLLNAATEEGVAPASYTTGFASVWIDLSKGLGCPVGAVLAGSRGFIEEAWFWKHRLGGALRQSGFLAAAGLYALRHNLERLAEDHDNARLFARLVAGCPGVQVFPEQVRTNILFLDVTGTGRDASELSRALMAKGVRLGVESPTRMRVVTHLDAPRAAVRRAAEAFLSVVAPAG